MSMFPIGIEMLDNSEFQVVITGTGTYMWHLCMMSLEMGLFAAA